MRLALSAFVLGAMSCGGHALRGLSAGSADANGSADASNGADASSTDAIGSADASPGPADGLNAGSSADAANEALGLASLCADPADGGLGQAQADGGLVVAVIVRSASTNTDGSEVDMYCDGSYAVYTLPSAYGAGSVPKPPIYYPPGTPWVVQCLAALQAVGDVSKIAVDTSNCMKSASFGTTTRISFNGKSTPDLQCPHLSDTAAQSAMLTACVGL